MNISCVWVVPQKNLVVTLSGNISSDNAKTINCLILDQLASVTTPVCVYLDARHAQCEQMNLPVLRQTYTFMFDARVEAIYISNTYCEMASLLIVLAAFARIPLHFKDFDADQELQPQY